MRVGARFRNKRRRESRNQKPKEELDPGDGVLLTAFYKKMSRPLSCVLGICSFFKTPHSQ